MASRGCGRSLGGSGARCDAGPVLAADVRCRALDISFASLGFVPLEID
jgi:hypothetical protein